MVIGIIPKPLYGDYMKRTSISVCPVLGMLACDNQAGVCDIEPPTVVFI
jgi:hypothetical protein